MSRSRKVTLSVSLSPDVYKLVLEEATNHGVTAEEWIHNIVGQWYIFKTVFNYERPSYRRK